MQIQFKKYQGTGNDFIILDNRDGVYDQLTVEIIRRLCDRKYGIGADGLMLMNQEDGYDFRMTYFNSDGNESTMCGNGGRCLVKFACEAGIHKYSYHFIAIDGVHEAEIIENGWVRLKMSDVSDIEIHPHHFILNTGSPHFVKFVHDIQQVDVYTTGRDVRYSKNFEKEGINVNFVERMKDDSIFVRTYERGVEDETLSCGTGVTAAALVSAHHERSYNVVNVETPGGKLSVEFNKNTELSFDNIWLSGPAEKVFEGVVEVDDSNR